MLLVPFVVFTHAQAAKGVLVVKFAKPVPHDTKSLTPSKSKACEPPAPVAETTDAPLVSVPLLLPMTSVAF
jgi:hypothetical protein